MIKLNMLALTYVTWTLRFSSSNRHSDKGMALGHSNLNKKKITFWLTSESDTWTHTRVGTCSRVQVT